MANLQPITITPGKTIFPGISHTKFVDDTGAIIVDASCANIINNPDASLLSLRLMNQVSQPTTLQGRQTGTKINLNIFSFNDYQMRRKAETLQYRKNQSPLSKKQQYAQISNSGGSYSSQSLLQKLNNNNCPNLDVITRPPTNSGVHDYKYPGYYYDANVPYLPSL
jgi:hypothetical protein